MPRTSPCAKLLAQWAGFSILRAVADAALPFDDGVAMTRKRDDVSETLGDDERDRASSNRLKRLRRIAAVAWLAWLGCVVVIWWIARWNVMHPHFLPLVGLLVVHATAAFYGVGIGLWGVLRGPGRIRTASWTAVSILPLLLSATLFALILVTAVERDIPSWLRSLVPPKLFGKTVAATAAPILDGVARVSHPHRIAGEKSVMFYQGVYFPQEDVALMDWHVEQMEELLGQRCTERFHWIRGSMLGVVHGFAFQGLAFGSSVDQQDDACQLASVDRHEAAHAVIQHLTGPDADPPSFLAEGWAESQSGSDPGTLARRAFDLRTRGPVPTLADLVGPEYYYHPKREVYVLGGALVDFLLRHSGGEKFFELYSASNEKTFAEDCRRILGVELIELDRLYWADVRRQVAEQRRKEEREGCTKYLVPLPATGYESGDLVPVFMDSQAAERDELASDVAARETFFAEYPSALRKLIDAYRQVRMTGKGQGFQPTPQGRWDRDYTVSYAQDGRRHHGQYETERERCALVVTPERSCLLSKDPGDDLYTVLDSDTGFANHQARYVGPILWYNRYLPRPYSFPIVNFYHGATIADWMASPDFVIRDIRAVQQATQRLVEVRFESRDGPSVRCEGCFVLDPERGWALSQFELQDFFDDVLSRTFTCRLNYGNAKEFPPVVKRARSSIESEDAGVFLSDQTDIEQVRFGPVDPREFQLDAYPIRQPSRPWMTYGAVAAGLLAVVVVLRGLVRSRMGKANVGQSE
jgi:hypothetical protein